jgi:hypothetical protein
VFIEIAVSDVSGTVEAGLRFSLVVDGERVRDMLKWVVGQISGMMNHMGNPTGMTPKQILSDDIYFQTMIFAQVRTPKVLGSALGGKENVTAGIVIGCNMTALRNLFGSSGGTWKVYAGLVLENIPSNMIPSVISVEDGKHTDMWLFRMTIEKAK